VSSVPPATCPTTPGRGQYLQARSLRSTVEAMAPNKQPTPEDRSDAIRIALAGLASGEESDEILSKLGALHIRYNTFPAEELLELASDAIDESGATPADPIDCEGIRERFLPEHLFSGKTQHHKSKYAISVAAMIHGGVYPDLLDDAAWWQADDLWTYSYFALLLYIRVAAERTGQSVEEVARSIADRRGVTLITPES
jgi:hypothetical protein